MTSKKDIEASSLRRLKALLPDFVDGRVEPTEEPDFLVHRSTSILGVELTELHREASEGTLPQQAAQAMRQRVVARAQTIFSTKGLPPVHATVFLSDTTYIRKMDVEPLATGISDVVERCLPQSNSSSEHKNWDDFAPFPDVIHHINMYRLDGLTKTFFSCPGATWIAELTVDDVKRCLSAKELRYSVYRRRCDEAWLLIDVDTASMSTWFECESGPLTTQYLSSFDRVFLLRHFGDKLHELSVTTSAA